MGIWLFFPQPYRSFLHPQIPLWGLQPGCMWGIHVHSMSAHGVDKKTFLLANLRALRAHRGGNTAVLTSPIQTKGPGGCGP